MFTVELICTTYNCIALKGVYKRNNNNNLSMPSISHLLLKFLFVLLKLQPTFDEFRFLKNLLNFFPDVSTKNKKW